MNQYKNVQKSFLFDNGNKMEYIKKMAAEQVPT